MSVPAMSPASEDLRLVAMPVATKLNGYNKSKHVRVFHVAASRLLTPRLTKKSTLPGHYARIMYKTAMSYLNGGNCVGYTKAIPYLERAAHKGYAAAAKQLGHIYCGAPGIRPDYAKAVLWYSRATALGCLQSFVELGHRYKDGDGVEQNSAMARSCYAQAAKQGNPAGLHYLGRSYYYGDDGHHDLHRAAALLRRAAAMKHYGSEQALARVEEDLRNGVTTRTLGPKQLESCSPGG